MSTISRGDFSPQLLQFWHVNKVIIYYLFIYLFIYLHSPWRSYFTDLWYDSWVQTIYSITERKSFDLLLTQFTENVPYIKLLSWFIALIEMKNCLKIDLGLTYTKLNDSEKI